MMDLLDRNPEVRHFQIILYIGAVVYPLWGWAYLAWVPGSYETIPGRLVVAALGFAIAISSRYSKFVTKHIEIFSLIFAIALTEHFFYLVYMNKYDVARAVGTFGGMVGTVCNVHSKKHHLIFSAVYLVTMMFLFYVLKCPFPEVILGLSTLTCLVVSFAALDSRGRIKKARDHAEEALAESRANAAHSARLSSLGEMAGGVAHEINNPLAIIYGRAGQLKTMVEEGKIDPKYLIETAVKIETTAMRIAGIVKGLREFSKEDNSETLRPFFVNNIIEDATGLCQERMKAHSVDLSVVFSEQNPVVACRSTQISQVLLNLILNSFDAVEAQKGSNKKWILVEVTDRSDTVEISVTDSGQGIPAKIRDKIMQPFFTTKPIGKGAGLGLSVSKGIVEAHQGKLRLDPESPNTRFVISLPRHLDEKKTA